MQVRGVYPKILGVVKVLNHLVELEARDSEDL